MIYLWAFVIPLSQKISSDVQMVMLWFHANASFLKKKNKETKLAFKSEGPECSP